MPSLYETVAEIERSGAPAALCTVIRARGSVPRHTGSKMLVHSDGRIQGTIGGGEMESRVRREALEALREGAPRVVHYLLSDPKAGDPGVCGGEIEVFVEPIKPLPTLLVIGGGHVGRALVHLGKWLGFRVVLNDDRPEYCNAEWAPDADECLVMSIRDLAARFKFHSETYVVMPTRGVPFDVEGLPTLLEVPHAYLGVIGSRRRWATAVKELEAQGVPPEKLAGVHAPMGLELNAETPEEIALSVMAEIIGLRRGGTGESMRMTNDELRIRS